MDVPFFVESEKKHYLTLVDKKQYSGFSLCRFESPNKVGEIFIDNGFNYSVFSKIEKCLFDKDAVEIKESVCSNYQQRFIPPNKNKVKLAWVDGASDFFVLIRFEFVFFAKSYNRLHSEHRYIFNITQSASFFCDDLIVRMCLQLTENVSSDYVYYLRQTKILLHYILSKYFCRADVSHSCSYDKDVIGAIHFITARYNMPISAVTIADHLMVDQQILVQKFKRVTGLSISAYLTQYRILKAKKYLQDQMSIIETSYAIGYQNPAYFSKKFKQVTGRLPSEYIKGF